MEKIRDIISIKFSLKNRKFLNYLPCFLMHNYHFEDDNACFGFRCKKCNNYLLVKDLTEQ